jgi:hypothetical protein
MGFTVWKIGLNDTAAFPSLKPGFKCLIAENFAQADRLNDPVGLSTGLIVYLSFD